MQMQTIIIISIIIIAAYIVGVIYSFSVINKTSLTTQNQKKERLNALALLTKLLITLIAFNVFIFLFKSKSLFAIGARYFYYAAQITYCVLSVTKLIKNLIALKNKT